MAIVKEVDVKVDTKTAKSNVDELNKSFEAQTDLIDELEKELFEYEKALKKTSKTNLAARKEVNDAIQKTKDRLKEEKFALKQLNKDRSKANDTLKESIDNQRDYGGVLGFIDQKTGGAISGFQKLIGTISSATKGFNLMKIAIIGTGIGALLIAITSVAAAFKGSEEGQNKFAKLMGVIGAVVGNIVDVLADLGDFIIDLFSGDGAAMSKLKSFGASIFNVIGLPIKNVIDTVKALGKVLGALFDGDISGAFDALKQGVSDVKGNFDEAADSINGATDALKDFAKQNVEEAKAAAKVADQRARADKIERSLLVDRAKAEREVAELRLKAKDLNNTTAKEREEALKKVLEIEDSLIGREQEIANLRRDAQIAENSFARSTKENLDEEERLKAEAVAVETRRLNKQRQVQRELTQAENEIAAERIAKQKERDAEEALAAKEKAAALEAIRLAEIDTEEERRKEELRKVEEQYTKLIEAAKKYNQDIDELEAAQRVKEEELRIKFAEEDKARQDKIEEEKKAKLLKEQEEKIAKLELDKENDNLNFEAQRELINQREALLLEDKTLNDKQRLALTKQFSEAKKKIDKEEGDFKNAQIEETIGILGNLQAVVGQQTVAGKALGIATATINTFQGASEALKQESTLPSPFDVVAKVANVAAVISTGFKTIKSIASVNIPAVKGASGGGSASAGSIPNIQPQAPNFNIVGASGTNQLAEAIGEQEQQPIQAYVVANDVTTAQSMDRNIVEGASIG